MLFVEYLVNLLKAFVLIMLIVYNYVCIICLAKAKNIFKPIF